MKPNDKINLSLMVMRIFGFPLGKRRSRRRSRNEESSETEIRIGYGTGFVMKPSLRIHASA
jgi:hypothetical protein